VKLTYSIPLVIHISSESSAQLVEVSDNCDFYHGIIRTYLWLNMYLSRVTSLHENIILKYLHRWYLCHLKKRNINEILSLNGGREGGRKER
jgi:hypothetical protein